MDSISIRYGEDVTLPIDTGDLTAETATIYIGKPGETFIFSKSTALEDGAGVFTFTGMEMRLPLGNYFYQINVVDAEGHIDKYPSPEEGCYECDTNFPKFVINESLDLNEVS